VVTASLPTASLLGTRTVQTIAVGGTVVRDDLTATGPIAVATIERYRFDVAVIGAAGVSARWGITELSDEEAEVQRAAIRRAETVVVLADGSKLGVELNAVVGPIDVITTLVTDASAPADELAALGRRGVDILVADASDGLETALDAPRASGRARAARS
jgi:DeoR/GlpR family transcriptional regulator of sugar metabolism